MAAIQPRVRVARARGLGAKEPGVRKRQEGNEAVMRLLEPPSPAPEPLPGPSVPEPGPPEPGPNPTPLPPDPNPPTI